MILLPSKDYSTKWYVIDNIAYRASGWLGCQLESYQWLAPLQNERRILSSAIGTMKYQWEIELHSYERQWVNALRYRCTWRLPTGFRTVDEYSTHIHSLFEDLERL